MSDQERKDIFADVKRLAFEAFADMRNKVLTIRDGFLNRAAACREGREIDKAEVWEEAAQVLTQFGLELLPGEDEKEKP